MMFNGASMQRLHTDHNAMKPYPLHWCHNEHNGISNHQPHNCLLNRVFRCRSKKISKLRATGFCAGNSLLTSEFPAQRASNVENVSTWWCHHGQWSFVSIYSDITLYTAIPLTHWGLKKWPTFCEHNLQIIFLTENIFNQISLKFILRVQLTISQHRISYLSPDPVLIHDAI